MGLTNIGGEVDVTDPRDIADLGDADNDNQPSKDEDTGNPSSDKDVPPKDDKGDLPADNEELEDIDDEEEEKDEEENKEDDEEDGEDDGEDDEIDVSGVHTRPSFKEISAKYPKFFKEFPAVREALGRERAYTEVFPTVDDAKEAGEVIQNFTQLEQSIMQGDPSLLLGSLHSKDEKALNKFAKNFLPTLQKGNEPLFNAIVTPYISRVLRNAAINAEQAGNENLGKAVRWMAKFIYGDPDGRIPDDPKEDDNESGKPSNRETQLAEENKNLQLTTLRNFAGDIKDRTEKVMESIILKTVDPEDALPEFMREALVGKIITEIQKTLNSDKEHNRVMTTLWNAAKKNGYSKEDRSQLISAFLARAKRILPSIRDKHKKEVLKKLSSTGKGKEGERTNTNRRRIPESGIPASRNGNPKARDINWKKTSDEDILNDKYVPVK